jgi:hypothetical protein
MELLLDKSDRVKLLWSHAVGYEPLDADHGDSLRRNSSRENTWTKDAAQNSV